MLHQIKAQQFYTNFLVLTFFLIILCNMYVVYLFLFFVYLVSADPDIGEIDGK